MRFRPGNSSEKMSETDAQVQERWVNRMKASAEVAGIAYIAIAGGYDSCSCAATNLGK